jgi:hypothetical protein
MAVVDLQMSMDPFPKAVDFLTDNAKGFEEIRMAAAAFEALKQKSAKANPWAVDVFKLQNMNGTFGQGAATARDTASCVVTLLRLDRKPPVPGVYLATLDKGQLEIGGWGKTADKADLETTYRVMRAYRMMRATPKNVDGVRNFIARCRNADGGYGIDPSRASSAGATYFAVIVSQWLKE